MRASPLALCSVLACANAGSTRITIAARGLAGQLAGAVDPRVGGSDAPRVEQLLDRVVAVALAQPEAVDVRALDEERPLVGEEDLVRRQVDLRRVGLDLTEELSLGPSLAAQTNDNQFVTESVDASGQPAFVMGRISQTTTALTLRMSYTFNPRLSLQVYAQPFVSSGVYDEYKQVVDPQARDYGDRYAPVSDDVMFETADFGFRQLRSNVVARWEYLPGSTLFAIWSHNRTSEDRSGGRGLGGALGQLAEQPGEHVVMLKLSYWLGI